MKKLLLFLLLLLIVGYFVWRWWNSSTEAQKDSRLVYDRVWLDHMPKNDRDTVNVFAAITEEPFGITEAVSAWKGNYEVFRYESKGDEIRAVWPQSGDRETITAKAWRCKENKMDFCLELSGSRRVVKRYYSQEGWEIGAAHSGDEVKARAEALVHAVPAMTE